MKITIKHIGKKTYSLTVWSIGLAVFAWSLWISYQQVNRAILNPPAITTGSTSALQHKLNNAAYEKVITAWNQKKEQSQIDTPIPNPFIGLPNTP